MHLAFFSLEELTGIRGDLRARTSNKHIPPIFEDSIVRSIWSSITFLFMSKWTAFWMPEGRCVWFQSEVSWEAEWERSLVKAELRSFCFAVPKTAEHGLCVPPPWALAEDSGQQFRRWMFSQGINILESPCEHSAGHHRKSERALAPLWEKWLQWSVSLEDSNYSLSTHWVVTQALNMKS